MDVRHREASYCSPISLIGLVILFAPGQTLFGQFSGGSFQSGPNVSPRNGQFPVSQNYPTKTQNQTPFAGQNTERINWMDGKNIDQAFRTAIEQNKSVMLHFWNERCQPCRALENYVFPNPILAQAINSQFIPVKVNTDQTPEIHQKYGVKRWPWDIFIAPSGAKLREGPSPNNASTYTQHVNAVAKMQSQFLNLAAAQNPSAPNTNSTNLGNSFPYPKPSMRTDSHSATTAQPKTPLSSHDPPSHSRGTQNAQPNPSRVENRFFKEGSQAENRLASGPAVGMEGFCPVSMLRETRKVRGSEKWGCIHRGKLYFFANQTYRELFRKDPDRYAPVLAGYDIVLYRETGKLVEGKTEFGGFVGQGQNRVVFLFASPDTKLKFISDKQGRYLETARTATRNARENWLR